MKARRGKKVTSSSPAKPKDAGGTLGLPIPFQELELSLSSAERRARAIFLRETRLKWEPCVGYVTKNHPLPGPSPFRVLDPLPSQTAMIAHNALSRIFFLRKERLPTVLEATLCLAHFRAGRDLERAGLLPQAEIGRKIQSAVAKGGKARRGVYAADPGEMQTEVDRLAMHRNLSWSNIKRRAAKKFGVCERTVANRVQNPRKKSR